MKIAQMTASFVSVIPSAAFHASGQRRYNGHDRDDVEAYDRQNEE